jgi:hypothetical protein
MSSVSSEALHARGQKELVTVEPDLVKAQERNCAARREEQMRGKDVR